MATYNTFRQLKNVPQVDLFAGVGGYVLREEQQKAVKDAMAQFGSTPRGGTYTVSPDYKQFLWNAKMRFGKTLCALHLAREMGIKRILIITHRPVVNEEWTKNFDMVFENLKSKYKYGTRSDKDNYGNYYELERFAEKPDGHYVFFASMQYLRRSTLVGGDNDEQLKKDLLQTDWDLVIVDEAHEGTRTALGQRVIDLLKKQHTKMLHLSGTPFNLYEDFKPGEIYTWDYIQEQQAKRDWPSKHPMEPNPYEELPQMKIYTFDLGKILGQFIEEGASFRFTDFFRTWEGQKDKKGQDIPAEKKGRFIHEDAVRKFLDKLCEPSETNNYPFSTDEWQQTFNHTLWIVPGVKEAKALKQLLCEHPVFGSFGEENIINVAGSSTEDEEREDALDRVKSRIGDKPELTATITISCGRLTTGVTVRPWTAVFYMKGSEMTSAATYMQTIFRVQSPYVERDAQGTPFRMKQECYVFDFAPDRSLKMVAETAKFSSLAKTDKKRADGEAMTQEERDKDTMRDFLELCPVVSLDDGQMVPYDEQKLFRQLESVYIDKLVTSGFNDNCLYNAEELMSIDSEELNDLGKKIAQSTNMEKPKNATPNTTLQMNQLTEEQRRQLEEAKRKARQNRKEKKDPYEGLTPEEIAALEAEKERKKKEREEREKRISNIRGISLRIPLLMYGGADAGDPKEDLTVENFTRKIKDESWEEFMPRGITKKDFNAIRRCYNATRFEEAGKRYRALAREADSMHVEDRIRRIADIFACFHNPDKETVLTPWRVVNMHMSDTLGGYCFFNEKFDGPCQKEILDEQGNVVDIIQTNEPRYVEQGEVTQKVFEDSEAKILEINSKTGLYPLYVAYSLYRRRRKDFEDVGLIEEQSVEEEQVVWDDIIRNNVFVICNTPMAVRITQRTLFGFREDAEGKANIKASKLVEEALNNKENLINNIQSCEFWKGKGNKGTMEFSAIVGNPPYQETNGGGGGSSDPIYNKFVSIAKKIDSSYLSFIIPARWTVGGRYLDDFREEMLNDKRIAKFYDYFDPKEIFPQVAIEGGICYFLRGKENKECDIQTTWGDGSRHYSKRYLKHTFDKCNEEVSLDVYVRDEQAVSIVEKVLRSQDFVPFSNHVKPRNYFKLDSMPKNATDTKNNIGIWGLDRKKNRTLKFIESYDIPNDEFDIDILNKWKVFVSKADGAAGQLCYPVPARIMGSTMRGGKNVISTITFLVIGPFEEEQEAINVQRYMTTKFFRFLLGIRKLKNVYWRVFSFVPYLDFKKEWTDKLLYEKYGITKEEQQHINDMIKDFDNELMLF